MGRFRLRPRRSHRHAAGGQGREMVPIKAIVPNLVTSMAACAGIMSITFSSEGRFVPALFALLVACVCDGMDGRVARMLNASSKLGAELDSLADFVNFGVAPALFMFFWLTGGPTHEGFAPETVRFVSCPKKSWEKSMLPSSVFGMSFRSRVVTWNISPAPSQSLAVISGVCT